MPSSTLSLSRCLHLHLSPLRCKHALVASASAYLSGPSPVPESMSMSKSISTTATVAVASSSASPGNSSRSMLTSTTATAMERGHETMGTSRSFHTSAVVFGRNSEKRSVPNTVMREPNETTMQSYRSRARKYGRENEKKKARDRELSKRELSSRAREQIERERGREERKKDNDKQMGNEKKRLLVGKERKDKEEEKKKRDQKGKEKGKKREKEREKMEEAKFEREEAPHTDQNMLKKERKRKSSISTSTTPISNWITSSTSAATTASPSLETFDPNGVFRGVEDKIFKHVDETNQARYSSSDPHSAATFMGDLDALKRATQVPNNRPRQFVPYAEKVRMERAVAGRMKEGEYEREWGYTKRASGGRKEDLGFAVGVVEEGKKRNRVEKEKEGEEEEEEGGEGEFYTPTKLVARVGEDDLAFSSPSSSSSARVTASEKSQPKSNAMDLTSYIDRDLHSTPTTFATAPLLTGFKSALEEMFGKGARPSVIQGLSLRWLLEPPEMEQSQVQKNEVEEETQTQTQTIATQPQQTSVPKREHQQKWRQFLLAAETGSGKSIAYLLPVLQSLKLSEEAFRARRAREHERDHLPAQTRQKEHNPRALILAPTHELARQLAGFAKELVHARDVKLRVMCASRANVASSSRASAKEDVGKENGRNGVKEKLRGESGVVFDNEEEVRALLQKESVEEDLEEGAEIDIGGVAGEGIGKKRLPPVDVLVGTPMKLLEMVHGRGFDRLDSLSSSAAREQDDTIDSDHFEDKGNDLDKTRKLRRGRDLMPHVGTWKHRAHELGLGNVEWVVVDEADVLFDPDFEEMTRRLLADVAQERGYQVPVVTRSMVESSVSNALVSTARTSNSTTAVTPINYPFNLLLTSATIPSSLNAYLANYHPGMLRLSSPALHRLPKGVRTEYEPWTGGNKMADVVRRVRKVWAEEWGIQNTDFRGETDGSHEDAQLSKILIFANKSSKVVALSEYLNENRIPNVPVTSAGVHRARGTNRHLEGFLRVKTTGERSLSSSRVRYSSSENGKKEGEKPRVMITTSLLSRGLDFSPDISHVFIVDEPRNMVDFIHRAGRVGRMGVDKWIGDGVGDGRQGEKKAKGTVVIFGKMKGRGSERAKGMRRRVDELRVKRK